jgi:hypothetical protein
LIILLLQEESNYPSGVNLLRIAVVTLPERTVFKNEHRKVRPDTAIDNRMMVELLFSVVDLWNLKQTAGERERDRGRGYHSVCYHTVGRFDVTKNDLAPQRQICSDDV